MDHYISLQKIPSLNFGSLNSRAQGYDKKLCTKTTRQQQLWNQKSCSYLKNNRSFKKGIYAHRLVEDVQDMQQQDFINKYLTNLFFKTQVDIMLKDCSEKLISEKTFKVLNADVMVDQEYQIRTLKAQREQIIKDVNQIHRKWMQWLNNAGIKPQKK